MPPRRRTTETTTGSTLHTFDLDLCRYVVDNIVSHSDDGTFVGFVRADLPDYVDFLVGYHRGDDRPGTLLSLDELDHLSTMLNSGDDPEFDRPWNSYAELHRRHINCLAEIRDQLAPTTAAEWGGLSTRIGNELESPRLSLVDGIEIVRDWIYDLRRLMRVMGAVEWLPVPDAGRAGRREPFHAWCRTTSRIVFGANHPGGSA